MTVYSDRTFIIAELSANHNNDFDLTKRSIDAMADAGADAVKVQTYTAESMALDIDNEYFGPKKEGLWKGYRPYDLYKEASMPWEWQPRLKKVAEDLGLIFFSTPFDLEAVDFLEDMDVELYKIASFEITDIPLIKHVAKKNKPVIISTGVADIDDINLAIKTCRDEGNNDIAILKCTSEYPATIDKANLNTIPDMKSRFGMKVGLSDHTPGSIVPIVAVSLGAEIVEKHFILDRSLGGHDSKFSLEPDEFKEMVHNIRNTESSLGSVNYSIDEQMKLKRRSLFAIKDIEEGEIITMRNIKSLRPGNGLHPKYLEEVLGMRTLYSIKAGTPLQLKFLKR